MGMFVGQRRCAGLQREKRQPTAAERRSATRRSAHTSASSIGAPCSLPLHPQPACGAQTRAGHPAAANCPRGGPGRCLCAAARLPRPCDVASRPLAVSASSSALLTEPRPPCVCTRPPAPARMRALHLAGADAQDRELQQVTPSMHLRAPPAAAAALPAGCSRRPQPPLLLAAAAPPLPTSRHHRMHRVAGRQRYRRAALLGSHAPLPPPHVAASQAQAQRWQRHLPRAPLLAMPPTPVWRSTCWLAAPLAELSYLAPARACASGGPALHCGQTVRRGPVAGTIATMLPILRRIL